MPSLESVPRGAALVGAAAALMSFGVVGVADAGVKPQPPGSGNPIAATVATPADHALVTAPAVPVRVSVGSRVSKIRVYADNRDVSRYFARRGDTFTARLPRKLLRAGTNRLLVQAITGAGNGGAATVSSFWTARRPG